MKLIQLNIRYDPDYPFDWATEQDYWEAQYPAGRKPRFPFSWQQSGVQLGRWTFKRSHIVTKGFDPYAGERWTLAVGKWLSIELSTVVAFVAELTLFGKTFRRHERAGKLPRYWQSLLAALEYRYEWWERNEHVEDPYGSLSSYE